MWIKICASTNLDDALLAAELGADAVGFVFAPSKRQVISEQVAAIISKLPPTLEKIGVFTSQDADEIAATALASGLTGVQLHSGFQPTLAQALRGRLGDAVTIIQTVHWRVDGDEDNAEELAGELEKIALEPAIDRVLIDSKSTKGEGGTGVPFDWAAARTTLSRFEGKIIVAGGLNPDNVRSAIHALTPWGVDVASGVEASPGKKDAARLASFMEAARSAS